MDVPKKLLAFLDNQFLETLTVRMVEMFKVCRNVMPCEVKKDTHLYTCGKIH